MSTLLLQKEEAGLRAAVMQDGRLYACGAYNLGFPIM